MTQKILIVVVTMMAAIFSEVASAQTDTTFTYQGELKENGSPANGAFDIEFELWNAATGGNQIGNEIENDELPVVNGRFTVELDFGANAFDNSDRWLEITVNGIELVPRQPITRAPYAIQTRGIFVDENYDVGIGTSQRTQTLDVKGRVNAYGLFFGNSSGIASDSINNLNLFTGPHGAINFIDVNLDRLMTIDPDGNIGIGTASPVFQLQLTGNAGKPGGGPWESTSDVRLKKNIQSIEGALGTLMSLRGVTFEYIDPEAIHELSGQRIGMIAQEVEKVVPDWVNVRSDGYKTVTPRGFEAMTVEALREMRAENEQLHQEKDSEIGELKQQVKDLRQLVHRLMSEKE